MMIFARNSRLKSPRHAELVSASRPFPCFLREILKRVQDDELVGQHDEVVVGGAT